MQKRFDTGRFDEFGGLEPDHEQGEHKCKLKFNPCGSNLTENLEISRSNPPASDHAKGLIQNS
jgi:hypothetical protein